MVFVSVAQPMYNLTVEEAHTFFVGDGQWLVHNASCPYFLEVASKWENRYRGVDKRGIPQSPGIYEYNRLEIPNNWLVGESSTSLQARLGKKKGDFGGHYPNVVYTPLNLDKIIGGNAGETRILRDNVTQVA